MPLRSPPYIIEASPLHNCDTVRGRLKASYFYHCQSPPAQLQQQIHRDMWTTNSKQRDKDKEKDRESSRKSQNQNLKLKLAKLKQETNALLFDPQGDKPGLHKLHKSKSGSHGSSLNKPGSQHKSQKSSSGSTTKSSSSSGVVTASPIKTHSSHDGSSSYKSRSGADSSEKQRISSPLPQSQSLNSSNKGGSSSISRQSSIDEDAPLRRPSVSEETNNSSGDDVPDEEIGMDIGGSEEDSPAESSPQEPPQQAQVQGGPVSNVATEDAVVTIVEQPASDSVRFRYECEFAGKSVGCILGKSSTPGKRSYPKIQIEGFKGTAVLIVISCVSSAEPYRAHPFQLVWRDGRTEGGASSARFDTDACAARAAVDPNRNDGSAILLFDLRGLRVDCVKRANIRDALEQRRAIKVDPFRQGFDHANKADIDLSELRLCFQVFIEYAGGKLRPLKPVVSSIIQDRRKVSNLIITDISSSQVPVAGDVKVMLLCNKVVKEDIQIWLEEPSEDDSDETGAMATTHPAWRVIVTHEKITVGKFAGLSFIAPPYKDQSISEPVNVRLLLFKISEQKFSEPIDLQYIPNKILRCTGEPDNSNGALPKVLETYSLSRMPSQEDSQLSERLEELEQALNLERESSQKRERELLNQLASEREEKDRLRTEARKKSSSSSTVPTASPLPCPDLSLILMDERRENRRLAEDLQKLSVDFHRQRTGIDNLLWQLEQKDKQVVALEKRLRETFPVLSCSSSPATAHESSNVSDAMVVSGMSGKTNGQHENTVSSSKGSSDEEVLGVGRRKRRKISYADMDESSDE